MGGAPFAAWWHAARPKTWPAAIVPVMVGSACAYAAGGFTWLPAVAALGGALFIQIGTNFANDLFDHRKGADNAARVGPMRLLQAGLVDEAAMRWATVAAFAVAVGFGLYLSWHAGPWIIVIGIASLLSGYAYTGGPWPLAYNGLGDLFVMLFFGFVAVCGTAFVHLGYVPGTAWWAAIPVGALASAILVVNNVRDHESDAPVGKKTLVVRFGRRFGIGEYYGLLLLSYATPLVVIAAAQQASRPFSTGWLLPLATLPLALRLAVRIRLQRGAVLNLLLAQTGQLLVAYGALLSLGLLWS